MMYVELEYEIDGWFYMVLGQVKYVEKYEGHDEEGYPILGCESKTHIETIYDMDEYGNDVEVSLSDMASKLNKPEVDMLRELERLMAERADDELIRTAERRADGDC